ncbi:MAG: hypothetical protein JWP34_5421 [Massilia sp.]|nr:hypothetical protein [Massilia sp.]
MCKLASLPKYPPVALEVPEQHASIGGCTRSNTAIASETAHTARSLTNLSLKEQFPRRLRNRRCILGLENEMILLLSLLSALRFRPSGVGACHRVDLLRL